MQCEPTVGEAARRPNAISDYTNGSTEPRRGEIMVCPSVLGSGQATSGALHFILGATVEQGR